MNVFFDVDFTLVMGDATLRPHAREAFERLVAAGHRVYVWSGVGIRRWDMRRHGLHDLVTDYFVKPLSDHRRRLAEFEVYVVPDFVVDDHASVVTAFGGYHIAGTTSEEDRSLLEVVEAVRAAASGPALATRHGEGIGREELP